MKLEGVIFHRGASREIQLSSLVHTKVSLIWCVQLGLCDLSLHSTDDGGASDTDHGGAVGGCDDAIVHSGWAKGVEQTPVGSNTL